MITVKVDASQAMLKFGPAGIPESVRRNLRAIIPDLTKRLGAKVEAGLNSELKSRNRLQVKKEMVENPSTLYGRVTLVTTSEPKLLPQWLEEGTRPHEIRARNASALFFFWEKMGANVAFQRVQHPGTRAYRFVGNAFDAMEAEIKDALTHAVKTTAMRQMVG